MFLKKNHKFTQLTIESARETSSVTAQQPGRKVKVLKLA